MDKQETRLRYALDFLASGKWIDADTHDYLSFYLDRCRWASEMSQEMWEAIPEWDFQELVAESWDANDLWKIARQKVPCRLAGIVRLLDDAFLRD